MENKRFNPSIVPKNPKEYLTRKRIKEEKTVDPEGENNIEQVKDILFESHLFPNEVEKRFTTLMDAGLEKEEIFKIGETEIKFTHSPAHDVPSFISPLPFPDNGYRSLSSLVVDGEEIVGNSSLLPKNYRVFFRVPENRGYIDSSGYCYGSGYIDIRSVPDSPGSLLTIFHEICHAKHFSNFTPEERKKFHIASYNFALHNKTGIRNKSIVLQEERSANAFALDLARKLFRKSKVDMNLLKTLTHNWMSSRDVKFD